LHTESHFHHLGRVHYALDCARPVGYSLDYKALASSCEYLRENQHGVVSHVNTSRCWNYSLTWTSNLESDRNGFESRLYDICEDMSVDMKQSEPRSVDQSVVLPLLYSPLPADLPTVDKDLLILAAACHSNIDRYMRLRRPKMTKGELACLIRGIYHDPLFAKFWSLQPAAEINNLRIRRAINARFIMTNDLSRITPTTPVDELPYCI
jgi:hypothetical protein